MDLQVALDCMPRGPWGVVGIPSIASVIPPLRAAAVWLRTQYRHPAAGKRLAALNVSYVCPKPVLANQSFLVLKVAQKGRFPCALPFELDMAT
jgi:hypothetical protein